MPKQKPEAQFVNVPTELQEELQSMRSRITDNSTLVDFLMFLSVTKAAYGGTVDIESVMQGQSFEIRTIEIKDRVIFKVAPGDKNGQAD